MLEELIAFFPGEQGELGQELVGILGDAGQQGLIVPDQATRGLVVEQIGRVLDHAAESVAGLRDEERQVELGGSQAHLHRYLVLRRSFGNDLLRRRIL